MGMEYVEQPTEHPAPTTPPKKRAREATTLKNIKIAAYAKRKRYSSLFYW